MQEILLHLAYHLTDSSVELSPVLLDGLAQFSECVQQVLILWSCRSQRYRTLQKVESYMRMQQDMGRIQRFFRQNEASAKLEECRMGLDNARDVLKVRMHRSSSPSTPS